MKKLASLVLDEEGRSMALPEGNRKGGFFCLLKKKEKGVCPARMTTEAPVDKDSHVKRV